MKTKKISLILSLLTLLLCFAGEGYAQKSERQYKRAKSKMYKKKFKELKREGWKLDGSSLSLEVALMKHYKKMDEKESVQELVSSVSMCKSKNVCRANALNNALIEYASKAGSYVKGRVTSDIFNDASGEVPQEFDKFYAAYERLVQQEIKGELQESFSLIKEGKDGNSYQIFYIIDEDEAHKARLRALERAQKETEIATQYGRQVSDFVNEGFEFSGTVSK